MGCSPELEQAQETDTVPKEGAGGESGEIQGQCRGLSLGLDRHLNCPWRVNSCPDNQQVGGGSA